MSPRPLLPAIVAALLGAVLALLSSLGATPTDDEPTYAGQGAYLLRTGDFYAPVLRWQPPLALYATSAGLPFVRLPDDAFATRPASDSLTALGDRLLYESPSPTEDVLLASRAGVVAAFAALCALSAWIAGSLGGSRGAWVAGLVVAASPAFFAHGGLATTDVVAAACALGAVAPLVAAFHARTAWSVRSAALAGAALGLALAAKHTAIVLVPVTLVASYVLARRSDVPRARAVALTGVSLLVAGAVVWASYGFHTGPLVPPDSRGDLVRKLGFAWAEDAARTVPVPAPAYWQSLAFQAAKQHDRLFFHYFGEKRMVGWWTYFPVVSLAKATLGSLALCAVAAWTVRGRRLAAADWVLLSAFALPFAAAVVSRHNLGVRHVLPALAPLLVVAGARAAAAPGAAARVATWGLLAVHLVEGATATRDGVAWWNLAAGGTSGGWRIAVQSNADWGQGLGRLADEVRERGLGDVWVIAAAGPASSLERVGRDGLRLVRDERGVVRDPDRKSLPDRGWLAVSTSAWRTPGHDPVTDSPPDLFLAGCFRLYRLPLQGERTP